MNETSQILPVFEELHKSGATNSQQAFELLENAQYCHEHLSKFSPAMLETAKKMVNESVAIICLVIDNSSETSTQAEQNTYAYRLQLENNIRQSPVALVGFHTLKIIACSAKDFSQKQLDSLPDGPIQVETAIYTSELGLCDESLGAAFDEVKQAINSIVNELNANRALTLAAQDELDDAEYYVDESAVNEQERMRLAS